MGQIEAHKSVLITGAAGYIGRHLVAQFRAEGRGVIAVLRPGTPTPKHWAKDPGITVLPLDLAIPEASGILQPHLQKVAAVVHAASSLGGDAALQKRDTISASENLLNAISALKTDPPKLVLLSSIAVYDASQRRAGDLISEASPLEIHPHNRDIYCQFKLAQEAMIQKAAARAGIPLIVLRLGAVFGPGRLWNSHLGIALGPVLLRLGASGEVPICYIEHAVKVVSLSLDLPAPHPDTAAILNVLDPDLPDARTYSRALQTGGWPRFILPLPWQFFALLATLFAPIAGARMPGLLRLAELRARMLPVTYSSGHMRGRLSWQPTARFSDVMAAAIAAEKTTGKDEHLR